MGELRFESVEATSAPPAAFAAVPGEPDAPRDPLVPGTSCVIALEADAPRARCSLGMRDDLHGAPGRTGMIGHYEALDANAGAALLRHAAAMLAREGAARVLGPMNGSTWARYRLALPTQPGDPEWNPPVFAGEPRNAFEYPAHFDAAGFTVNARYESRADDLTGADTNVDDARALAHRVAGAGFSLRPIDLARFDEELVVLFDLSLAAFADNLYYAPIAPAEFKAMYEPMRARIDPDLVSIALDREERPCGFLFGFEDPIALHAGVHRVIVKTVAVSPGARGHGLANHMLDRVRWTARRRGCTEVVHALMHVTNFSMKMSARHGGQLFRRYGLWQWTP